MSDEKTPTAQTLNEAFADLQQAVQEALERGETVTAFNFAIGTSGSVMHNANATHPKHALNLTIHATTNIMVKVLDQVDVNIRAQVQEDILFTMGESVADRVSYV